MIKSLKFIGRPDVFVTGVPQRGLVVVDEPKGWHEVTPAQAEEILKSGLYEASDEVLSEPQPSEEPAESKEE